MNPDQILLPQLYGSTQPTRNASLVSLNQSDTQSHQVGSVNPLLTYKDIPTAPLVPRSHLGYPFLIPGPYIPSFSFAQPSIPATRSPSSARILSNGYTSLQPRSTRPSPSCSSSALIPHPRSVPSKRSLEHTSNPPKFSTWHLPTKPSQEPLTKRQRVGIGHSGTAFNPNVSQPPTPSRPSSLIHASTPSIHSSNLEPKQGKMLVHPLAVDWSRPVIFVDPRPSSFQPNPRRDHVPVDPFPDTPYPKRTLEEELKGSVDPQVDKELSQFMWEQQERMWERQEQVWLRTRRHEDPFLRPIPISLPDNGSSSPRVESVSGKPTPEVAALYSLAPRNNESTHLGGSLTDPNAAASDDDDGGGFLGVLDLYFSAVQGSTLSRELELEIWGDDRLTGIER